MCLALVLTLLTSCGLLAQQPPEQAVRLAVIQQLSHAQQSIAQTLGAPNELTPSLTLKPNFRIDKLDIASREKVSEKRFQQPGYPSDIYKVSGTLSTTLTAANRKIQQNSPFEVYLGTYIATKPTKVSQKALPQKSTAPNSAPEKDPEEFSVTNPEEFPGETWFLIDPSAIPD